jgi:hypothetical protein
VLVVRMNTEPRPRSSHCKLSQLFTNEHRFGLANC